MLEHGTAPFTECSSHGDKRLSTFYARIRARGNRSIEDIYKRAKSFAGSTNLDARAAEVDTLFGLLWDEYISENPDLIPVLTAASGLSNRFWKPGTPCQAAELWRIRSQHLTVPEAAVSAATPTAGAKRTLAIIGTAGRKEDAAKLTSVSFDRMVAIATDLVRTSGATHLVSGGAAWADHVAVALALNGVIPPANLTLRLPASMKANQFDPSQRDGGTANYYHGFFAKKLGRNTLAEISRVAEQGANVSVNMNGFFARNIEVAADADVMLAFTFGSGPAWTVEKFAPKATARDSNLKDGGTAHTWNTAVAEKYHVTLAA